MAFNKGYPNITAKIRTRPITMPACEQIDLTFKIIPIDQNLHLRKLILETKSSKTGIKKTEEND